MSEFNSNPNDLPGAIAIIGLAGRFPQAKDLEAFWQNLKEGREVVSFFSEEELLEAGLSPEFIRHPNYVPARAILENAEDFDAGFFGYSPREAEIIDPQQRQFLECAWEALEIAGYDSDRYEGAIGVYGGLSMNSYLITNILANQDVANAVGAYQIMLGNDKDFLTTRVSYKLNLKGPSVNIQTACSTSLVAVQMACQSLLNYQCDMALAGGVSVSMPRKAGYLYQPGMIMSPDGHCRAFDHRAQGIVSGEGVGIVVLKRYADAVKDGDTIHAVIRGAAINNDGALKVGYTAPSVDGQAEAILTAQAVAGVEPQSITYIEAHGTGTELGDPIEISALTQAFRTGTEENGFCAIGSVKTHMGHLDAAAGVAGLIKTVLALQHKMIPPSLNFEKPNPRIDFDNSPFYVNSTLKEWKTDRLPRRAGVSSFGIGGTNAHVVLEEAPSQPAGKSNHAEQVLLLSARSEAALQAASRNLANWLRNNPSEKLADAAYTLQVGRKVFNHRRVVVCSSSGEAAAALESQNPKRVFSGQANTQTNPVAFLFPGQGAQYVNMGRGLYENEPVFRDVVDQCAEILKPHLGLDLRSVLYPAPEEAQKAQDLLTQTWITQPALFVIEYATARLWMAWSIQPKVMVGHSIGEYVAACLAGVFSLEDGLALVAARGKLMQSLPNGSMLSVPLSESEITPLLNQDLSLAVINAPRMCVVSGPQAAVERLQSELTARGVACRRLHTSHAFHSVMMEPILAPFTDLVRKVKRHAPQIPYLSNLTGNWITDEQAISPDYWAAHLRSTVRFSQNMEVLFQQGVVLLEVGPGQMLSTLARQHPKKPANQAILTSIRHPQEGESDTVWITAALGRLWLAGVTPDWDAYHAGANLHRIPLPTYPFEHKRYSVEPQKQAIPTPGIDLAQLLSKRPEMSSWFYLPSWQRSAWPQPSARSSEKHNWLVFSDATGVSQAVIDYLIKQGHTVNQVVEGSAYLQTGDHAFRLRADSDDDYIHLLNELSNRSEFPSRILHLWTLTAQSDGSLEHLQEMQVKGFYSLLSLTKALSERAGNQPVTLLIVSNHLHEVTGGEPLDAAKSVVLGPAKVIPVEFPNITCRSVDIVLPDGAGAISKAQIDHLLAEFDLPDGGQVAAHRGSHRWVQSYIPSPLPEPAEMKLREGGVYLITGGYGGIGLALADFIARESHARLVLVGRSGLPDRHEWQAWLETHTENDETSQKIRKIQEIEACSASVLTLKADVASLEQMQAVIRQVKQQFGEINGVIHAAGVPGGGIIQLKSKEQAERVLNAKVQGTWVIDQALKDEPLDFLVLSSSINSVMGVGGQVDYSAANAYQDGFAAEKAAQGRNVISINWAAWQEVGMAVTTEVPAHYQHIKEDNLRNGIHPSEGYDAFKRVLTNPAAQVIVSPRDLLLMLQVNDPKKATSNHKQAAESPRSANEERQPEQMSSHSRPGISTPYTPPVTETEKRLINIWEDLIGVQPIGINDNFFELGGHSLMATQILARIRDYYAVELSLRVLFEANTVAELGKQIDATLWVKQMQENAREPSDSDSDREEIAL